LSGSTRSTSRVPTTHAAAQGSGLPFRERSSRHTAEPWLRRASPGRAASSPSAFRWRGRETPPRSGANVPAC